MTRRYRQSKASGFGVLLVDDDADYAAATKALLEGEGHRVWVAENGQRALELVQSESVDLMLLDYSMPGMTGEQVVTALRCFSPSLQVVLQTGYANERPPRELLQRLDIQGYVDKSEGPEKLLLWTDAGLKAAATLARLTRSKQGMRRVLELSPALHKVQPVQDLYELVVEQLSALLPGASALLVVPTDSEPREGLRAALRVGKSRIDVRVAAASGRFVADTELMGVDVSEVVRAIRGGDMVHTSGASVLPLSVGLVTAGAVVTEPALSEENAELVRIYCNQATVAIHNMQLYEMAALDPLTGVHARRFLDDWTRREVRTAFRAQLPLSLLMLDLDDFKRINDGAGHLVGDLALVTFGKVLRQAMRENDIVGRYGGDEFTILLPHTASEGAEQVAQRIYDALRSKFVDGAGTTWPLRASIGIATLAPHEFRPEDFVDPVPQSYFQDVAHDLIGAADAALYRAKHAGKDRFCVAEPCAWPPLPAGD